jgi:signal transduction histidine kinase
MKDWWVAQWTAVRESFIRERVLEQSQPLSIVVVVLIGVVSIGVPAYIEPFASATKMHHGWLPILVYCAGALVSLTYWKVEGRGDLGAALTLVDTALYVAGASLAVALASPPSSYAYATLLGLMMAATQAREHSFTAPLALAFCVPSLSITAMIGRDAVSTFLVAVACALAMWVSYHTGRYRRMSRREEGLLSALSASHQLADASVELALANTLLGIGNFMHELRNTQSAVKLSLEYLKENGSSGEDGEGALRDAILAHEAAIALTTRTIEELRSRSATTHERFRLDRFVERWIARSGRREVLIDGPIPPLELQGSQDHLESVLTNLCRNAQQAGARTVRVQAQLEPSAAGVALRVSDDGPGLPTESVETLFQPFVTISRSGGTGLGLYLSRRRVELMGGTLTAFNLKGGGAMFEIRLPGRLVSEGDPANGEEDVAHHAAS